MKYLLSIISILGVTSGSVSEIIQNNKTQNKTITDLFEISFDSFVFDIKGETNKEKIKKAILLHAANDNSEEAKKFVSHFLENKNQYLVLGGIDVLPQVDKTKHYSMSITALNNNQLYQGTTKLTFYLKNSGIHLERQILVNEYLNFSNGYRLWTSWWVWDEYSTSMETKIIKWTDYAGTWSEFLDKYDQGYNKQSIYYNVWGMASTDFYAEQSISTRINIEFNEITTYENKMDGYGESIYLYKENGTSKVSVDFYTSVRRNNEYIIISTEFYLGIGSFASREVELNAIVTGLTIGK